jgi:hypothetical protein
MADRTTSILARLDTVLFFSDTLISLSVGNTGEILARPVDGDPTTHPPAGEFYLSVTS